MAKSTHDKELERARAHRADERAEKKRATALVVVLVAVLVVGAVVFGGVLLLRGGADDGPTMSDAVEDAASLGLDSSDGSTTTSDSSDSSPSSDSSDSSVGTSDGATSAAVAASPCEAPGDDVPTPRNTPYTTQPTVDLTGVDTVTATMVTSCGTVVMQLNAAAAPVTVSNFVALAEDGYFDGVGFHRVIEDFMIQGGDPTGTGTGCVDAACEQKMPGYQFNDELTLAEQLVRDEGGYPRGTVAMANAGPNTNGSQFFIVQKDPSYALSAAYTVFGAVAQGMDIVDQIVVGPSAGDQAVDPVIILSVSIER
jgi:cyclophilin family peptidyl-prolyl cis-trans isomerase